jgi:hypothetical protein
MANISYCVCLAEDWDWKSFPTRVLQKKTAPSANKRSGKNKNTVPTEETNTITQFLGVFFMEIGSGYPGCLGSEKTNNINWHNPPQFTRV